MLDLVVLYPRLKAARARLGRLRARRFELQSDQADNWADKRDAKVVLERALGWRLFLAGRLNSQTLRPLEIARKWIGEAEVEETKQVQKAQQGLLRAARKNLRTTRRTLESMRMHIVATKQKIYALEYEIDYNRQYHEKCLATAASKFYKRAYEEVAERMNLLRRPRSRDAATF